MASFFHESHMQNESRLNESRFQKDSFFEQASF